MPFITEKMYQNLKKVLPKAEQEDSVHYQMIPSVDTTLVNPEIESAVHHMQSVIELARVIRDREKLPLKLPLSGLIVIHKNPQFLNDIKRLENYVIEELNVRVVEYRDDKDTSLVQFRAEADGNVLGKRFGKEFPKISKAVAALSTEQLRKFQNTGEIVVDGFTLVKGDIYVKIDYVGKANYSANSDGDVMVLLDKKRDDAMLDEAVAREIVNRVQKLRKKAGLRFEDEVEVFYDLTGKETTDLSFANIERVIKSQDDFLRNALKLTIRPVNLMPKYCLTVINDPEVEINGAVFGLRITLPCLVLSDQALKKYAVHGPEFVDGLKSTVATKDIVYVKSQYPKGGNLKFTLNDKPVELCLGVDVFFSLTDLLESKQ